MKRLRLVLLLALVALVAAGCSSSGASDISVKVGDGQASSGNGQFALSLQLLVALTVLSLVPAILMLATSFTRIVVVLSLLRSALGIPQLPPNQVLVGLSLFLTLFVMAPVLTKANNDALQPYFANTITQQQAFDRGVALAQARARAAAALRATQPSVPFGGRLAAIIEGRAR